MTSKSAATLRYTIGLVVAGAILLSVQAATVPQSPERMMALAPKMGRISIAKPPELKAPSYMQPVPGKLAPYLITHGNPHIKTVMLTFDDGPHPASTPRILAVLRKYKVKATFFVVGKMAAKYPGLVKAIVDDGHTVANHTYDHVRLTRVSEQADCAELQECSDTIQAITGTRPAYCRPPGCRMNKQVLEAAAKMDMKVVSYTVNTLDTIDQDEHKIAERVVRNARNGGIILCHDGLQRTIDALPHIIRGLERKGYSFATITEARRSGQG